MQLRSYALVALAALIWGSLGVMAKTLYAAGVTPWALVFLRASISFVACGALILVFNREWLKVKKGDLPFLAFYGLVSISAFFALYLYTISLTSVAVAAVLLYTAPAFAGIMARFAFGEAITLPKIAALLLTFGGCILVVGIDSTQAVVSPLGIATGLGSALTYATFGIMGKRARQSYGPMTIFFYPMGFATLFLIPVLAIPGTSLWPYPPQVWLLLLALALGPTLLSWTLYVAAVKHVEASRAAIVATVEPVSAAIFALLILGESLSPNQWLGGALVLAGAVLAQPLLSQRLRKS